MTYTVKETARISGLSASKLRYYDQIKLVSPRRGDNDYRYYDETDITVLKYLKVMKFAGFSINEMKSIVEINSHEASEDCNQRARTVLGGKVTDIEKKISHLQQINTWMKMLLDMSGSMEQFEKNQSEINELIIKMADELE